uniref:glycosyltransferase n=1 Tax=Algoriphagus sp. TaxID=1872435 RepID=UPI004047280C
MEVPIDIMIPNMNGAQYLKTTLESIILQSYTNYKVYLIDNASTDESIEIFQSFEDNRFVLVEYSERVSLAENLNRCLKNVKSDLFCIMHTDDIYSPDYLNVMSKNLISNEVALISFCDSIAINDKGIKLNSFKYLFKRISFDKPGSIKILSSEEALLKLFSYNFIVAPSVMYKKDVISKIGYFNENQMFVVDWEYYFRILFSNNGILKINSPHFYYRLHKSQLTYSMTSDLNKYSEMLLFKSTLIFKFHKSNFSSEFKSNLKYRYKFPLYLSILYDSFLDLFSLRFSMFYNKILFIFKLKNIEN